MDFVSFPEPHKIDFVKILQKKTGKIFPFFCEE